MSKNRDKLKAEILSVLQHPEASDGLYFRNFAHLHEEDERPAVEANEVDILDALKELLTEGKITMDESGKEVIFALSNG